jgi:hypothetical protein
MMIGNGTPISHSKMAPIVASSMKQTITKRQQRQQRSRDMPLISAVIPSALISYSSSALPNAVDRVDRAYYEAKIKPLLKDPRIEFIGEIGG